MSEIVIAGPVDLAKRQALAETVQDYLENHGRARSTRRAYAADWADFCAWCEEQAVQPLPAAAETVAAYLADRASLLRPCTLQRRLSAISWHHRARKQDSPTRTLLVQELMEAIRRRHGTEQVGKDPVLVEDLRRMLEQLPDGMAGLRDRALLLVGFAGAFRRSELVVLDLADLEFVRSGLVVHLRRSKTDQQGAGAKKGIPYGSRPNSCPVRALRVWLAAAGITEGPVFRRVYRSGRVGAERLSDRAVALVVQRHAGTADLDPARVGGHSLRSGLATSAAAAAVEEREIMKQGGWKSVAMVRRYIKDGELFQHNAAGRVGL